MSRSMKSVLPFLTGFFALVLFLSAPSVRVLADGTETLGAPSIDIAEGSGVVTAGTGLIMQPGTIDIDVPGEPQQALLYWACRGAGDNSINVDGNPVTGDLIGGGGATGSSFRADITNLVASGMNSFSIDGLSCGIQNDGAGLLVIFDNGAEGSNNAFSGEATVLGANLLGIGLIELVSAGPLPPQGGSDFEQLVGLSVPGVLNSGTATASTMGSGNMSESQATVEGLNLNVLNLITLSATVIDSLSIAACDDQGNASVSGSSQLASLNLNVLGINVPIVISGAPNQTIDILGLVTIVINEQVGSASGNVGEINTNALRISVLGGALANVVVASAHADIVCDAGSQASKIIDIRDGFDFAFAGSSGALSNTTEQVFNFDPVDFDRVADLNLFVGDALAGFRDRIRIRVDGVVTDLDNRLDSSDGPQWDSENISVFIPAGASQVRVRLISRSPASTADSIIWVLAAFCLPTSPDGLGITFSGDATVVRATILSDLVPINVSLVEAGPLPPQGGSDFEQLLLLNIPGILSSGTATASTMGAGTMSESQATLEGLNLNLLGLGVSLTAIDALATAQCDQDGNASVSGSSQLVDLTINGNPITITGQPNQTINLGLIQIIINEQMSTTMGGVGDINVIALHIIVSLGDLNIADVRIASAHADINCVN